MNFAEPLSGVPSAFILFFALCDSSPFLPLTPHLDPHCSAEKSRHKMFTSLSDYEPSLRGQPVRVYRPEELNSLSNRTADIYVLWLFQPLPANYPADQSAAPPVSCFHPLWQCVTQACCSATDAVGVRAQLCCSWKTAVM